MIKKAVEILAQGGLVAFPTETVYGLGADARSSSAVQKIFAAKGRPSSNPLIVHVANAQFAQRFCTAWPEAAERLAHSFWPGPLTLVLPKAESIANEVTAGRSSVGLRVPDHPLALELLRAFEGPLAAPSANRANHISPTRAEHVIAELGDAVDVVLDGGPCAVGIESTVIDLTGEQPIILRPGGVTREQIEAVIGPVKLFQGAVAVDQAASSPGQHQKHYSPRTPAFYFEHDQRQSVNTQQNVVLIVYELTNDLQKSLSVIQMPVDPREYARLMYSKLRDADAIGADSIFVQLPPNESRWYAVRDRLLRATLPWVEA